jgi:UPF0271 protein
MVREQTVTTPEGEPVPIVVDTLCVHGDTPAAVAILRAVREAFVNNGVMVMAFGA